MPASTSGRSSAFPRVAPANADFGGPGYAIRPAFSSFPAPPNAAALRGSEQVVPRSTDVPDTATRHNPDHISGKSLRVETRSFDHEQAQSFSTLEGTEVTDKPERELIDLSRDPTPGVPDHAAPEGAGVHPLIDLSRDPNPGVPDHAKPDDEG
jgi:hypothetical protein